MSACVCGLRTGFFAASLVLATLLSTTATPALAATERFRPVAINDLFTGAEAYRILVPDGWRAEGGVSWKPERAAAPTSLTVRASNPSAPEAYNFFPLQLFRWSWALEQTFRLGAEVDGVELRRPPGRAYLGPGPDELLSALRMLMPMFRPQVRDYSVISAEALPRLAEVATARYRQPGAPPGIVRAGRLVVEYREGREIMREEFTCLYIRVGDIGGAGVIWGLDDITSFKAPKGQLDELLPVFRTMAFSLRPNLEWYNEMKFATQLLIQGAMYTQDQIMERVQIARRTNVAISRIIRQEYEARQAVSHMHDNYDTKAIRGVERHNNPFTGSTEDVPSEYSYAWVNSLGDHIFTNRESFNPNIGSNLHWQEMEKVK